MNICPLCQKPILPYSILEEEECTEEFCSCDAVELILAEVMRRVYTGGEESGGYI